MVIVEHAHEAIDRETSGNGLWKPNGPGRSGVETLEQRGGWWSRGDRRSVADAVARQCHGSGRSAVEGARSRALTALPPLSFRAATTFPKASGQVSGGSFGSPGSRVCERTVRPRWLLSY